MCLDVNRGGTNRNRCTETCNLAGTEVLMNPDQKPKTRSAWPTLWGFRSS